MLYQPTSALVMNTYTIIIVSDTLPANAHTIIVVTDRQVYYGLQLSSIFTYSVLCVMAGGDRCLGEICLHLSQVWQDGHV